MVNDISVLRCILELAIAFRNNLQAAVTHARRATVGADKVATHGNIPVGALSPVAVGRAVTKGTRAHSLALLQRIVGPSASLAVTLMSPLLPTEGVGFESSVPSLHDASNTRAARAVNIICFVII